MTAKLFIDGDERELHYVDMDYNRITSFIGWPVSEIFGGLIHLRFTPRGDEDFFLNWMFAQRDLEYPRCLYTFKNGEVVFYEGDVTEDIFFKYRFADCILIRYKETFSNQWGMETEMVLSPAIQYYNPKSKYPFLKRWNESYVPPSEQTPYQPIEITDEFYVSIKHLTDKEAFVPLGIPAFDGTSENQYIEFEMEIMENDIDDFIIEFLHDNKVVQSYISGSQTLDEVVVKGKGSGKASNTNTSNNPKSASNYPVGKFKIQWDGFDGNGVYDSTVFTKGKFKARIKAKRQGKEKSAETGEFSFGYKEVNWVDTKINKNSKRIDVTLRVNLKDGGEIGTEKDCYELPRTDMGQTIKICPWDEIPEEVIEKYGKLPMKSSKNIEDLKHLALQGINTYWSRHKENIGKGVKINGGLYEVFVKTINDKNGMVAPELVYFTNSVNRFYTRSHNWEASRKLFYKEGYLKNNDWLYLESSIATKRFLETSAHEIGHELLSELDGEYNSYTHKRTSHWSVIIQDPVSGTTYPATGEIDIMKYADDYLPTDYYDRVILSEADLTGLIWLSKIKQE